MKYLIKIVMELTNPDTDRYTDQNVRVMVSEDMTLKDIVDLSDRKIKEQGGGWKSCGGGLHIYPIEES